MIGVLQGVETLKLLLGVGEPLIGRLLLFDALALTLPRADAAQGSRLPAVRRAIARSRELIDYEAFCGVVPGIADANAQLSGRSRRPSSAAGSSAATS